MERASYKFNPEDNTPAIIFNTFLFQYTFQEWFAKQTDHHELRPTSAIIHHLSQFFPYKEFCEKNHRELDPKSCAVAYTWYKRQDQLNDAGGAQFRIIGDYQSGEDDGVKLLVFLRKYSRYLIHFGLLFYLLGVQLSKKKVKVLVFLLNMVFHLPSLKQYFMRTGADTLAYVNQAGQFMAGQTNYEKISSA